MTYIGIAIHNGQECYTFMKGAVQVHIVKDSVDSLGTAASSAKAYFFGD